MGWPNFRDFSLLDWMIHFGVLVNILVSLYIVWHIFTR